MNIYEQPLIIDAKLLYKKVGGKYCSDGALITWAMMLKFPELHGEAQNRKIAEIRGYKKRQIKRHKEELAKYGACQVIERNGRIVEYIPVDPAEFIRIKTTKFLQQSRYFQNLHAGPFSDMQSRDAEKLYYILSGLEFQYRVSKRDMKDAMQLLHTCFNVAFNPVKAFKAAGPDWWEKVQEHEQSEKERKKKAAEDKKQKAAEREALKAKEKEEEQEIKNFISSLSEAEYNRLEKLARSAMRKNGGIPPYGAKIFIEEKMYELGGSNA
ncbi:MAG: hypothetical protein HY808_03090 [Nitrospirae bacterium]|nr:hypothetical protein [Nitrospirota bacterium]